MPDGFGIKDLPDSAKIDDGKAYLVPGKWLRIIFDTLVQLWRGENVNKGPNILIRQFGLGGYSISSTAFGSGGGAGALHGYYVYDGSTGNTPKVGVTPGTHNGIVPTIYGNPINVKTGTPPAYPLLTLGSGDTLLYFQIDYEAGGQINTIEIMSTSSTLPTATISPTASGTDYKALSTVAVSISGSSASVQCNNDAVSGPQGYMQCNTYSNVWLV